MSVLPRKSAPASMTGGFVGSPMSTVPRYSWIGELSVQVPTGKYTTAGCLVVVRVFVFRLNDVGEPSVRFVSTWLTDLTGK